ncbi:MAG: hypothetical protein WD176_09590, partial [Pirellulales bacterium]
LTFCTLHFVFCICLPMIYPHRIRLNGPWTYEVLPPGNGGGEMRLPGDWRAALGRNFTGSVRFGRRFNCPTGLEPHERVWLVVPGGDAAGQVLLNEQPLGQVLRHSVAAEFDMTAHLLPHNQLTLDVEVSAVLPGGAAPTRVLAEPQERGPLGNVRLEIRQAASA